jgi:hypothetical protein
MVTDPYKPISRPCQAGNATSETASMQSSNKPSPACARPPNGTRLYGAEDQDQGWFLGFHCLTKYVKVAFFRGASLRPVPPGVSKQKEVRCLDLYEGELDEAQFASWVQQASQLPGEKNVSAQFDMRDTYGRRDERFRDRSANSVFYPIPAIGHLSKLDTSRDHPDLNFLTRLGGTEPVSPCHRRSPVFARYDTTTTDTC